MYDDNATAENPSVAVSLLSWKYEGDVDSSKVPPEWNGWLRYTSNKIPSLQKKYSWEKKHIKNQTGTKNSYYPSA